MLKFPEVHDLASLVDWAETSCLFSRQRYISRSEVKDTLGDELVEEPDLCDDIWANLTWRGSQCSCYPFSVNQHTLTCRVDFDHALVYAFQLLLSQHASYDETNLEKATLIRLARVFEELTTYALKAYLSGRSYRFGWPRVGPLPKGFAEAVQWVAREMHENCAKPTYGLRDKKDMGTDVIAWRGFEDRRSGKVIILAQCTVGRNWESCKGRDIALGLWDDLVAWPAKPLVALAVPFVEHREQVWSEQCRSISCSGGILLDRLRIANLCGRDRLEPSLARGIRRWCQSQIKRLPFES